MNLVTLMSCTTKRRNDKLEIINQQEKRDITETYPILVCNVLLRELSLGQKCLK